MEQPGWEGARSPSGTANAAGDAEKQSGAEFKMYDPEQILLPLICP